MFKFCFLDSGVPVKFSSSRGVKSARWYFKKINLVAKYNLESGGKLEINRSFSRHNYVVMKG